MHYARAEEGHPGAFTGRRANLPAGCLFRAVIALLWMFPTLSIRGQEAPQAALPPGVQINIRAQPLKATVGDPIQIDLDITLPRDYQLLFPQLPSQAGDFVILETQPGRTGMDSQASSGKSSAPTPSGSIEDSGMVHHRTRIVAAVYKTGTFDFPALPLVIRDPAGTEIRTSSSAVRIEIESVLSDQDSGLHDLKKQADIEGTASWLWWLLLVVPALLLIFFLIRKRLKRRHQGGITPFSQAEIDPLDLAETDLKDLVGRGLPARGMIKQFYVLLSEIVKRALEASYRIQTVEKTTLEIMSSLRESQAGGTTDIPAPVLERVETLLLSCDMVKFARYIPSQGENDKAISEAFAVIADCRETRQPAAPGTAPVAGVS